MMKCSQSQSVYYPEFFGSWCIDKRHGRFQLPAKPLIANFKSLRRVTFQKYLHGPNFLFILFLENCVVDILHKFTPQWTYNASPAPVGSQTLHFFWPTVKLSSNVLYNTSTITWPNIPNGEFRRGFRLSKWRGGRRRG